MARAYQHDLQYERTAWLKVLGLLLQLWDERNFSLIAKRSGRVVAPFNEIAQQRDYSMGKIGIPTSQRSWINDQVTIIVDGKTYNIGVVEYTDDWSPFHRVPFDKVEDESEDDSDVDDLSNDDDEEEEAVSETWVMEW